MAELTYTRKRPSFKCTVSDIVVKNKKRENEDCCDALFLYEPVEIDFGNTTDGWAHRNEILESQAQHLCISTSFQTLYFNGITDIIMMDGGKLAIKFESLIIA